MSDSRPRNRAWLVRLSRNTGDRQLAHCVLLPPFRRWIRYLLLPQADCELVCKSSTFLLTIWPMRRARATSPIRKCTVSIQRETLPAPTTARPRHNLGSSPRGWTLLRETPHPPAIHWILLW